MKALDTNILARFILNDDPDQARLATGIMATPVYIPDTVLLELAWLLSSRYRFGRQVLADTLADLIQLPSVMVSDHAQIAWAVQRFAAGADFADMVHLVGARHADSFVSFEVELARLAGPDTPVPIERPL